MYRIYSFEKLEVYREILDFTVKVKDAILGFPKEERYDLCRQLKRSVDSIGANLAEGSGRSSNLDQAHFTNIAYGSALDKIIKQLNGLYKYQLNNKQNLKIRLKD
jgi:four helix bundle protein